MITILIVWFFCKDMPDLWPIAMFSIGLDITLLVQAYKLRKLRKEMSIMQRELFDAHDEIVSLIDEIKVLS